MSDDFRERMEHWARRKAFVRGMQCGVLLSLVLVLVIKAVQKL